MNKPPENRTMGEPGVVTRRPPLSSRTKSTARVVGQAERSPGVHPQTDLRAGRVVS